MGILTIVVSTIINFNNLFSLSFSMSYLVQLCVHFKEGVSNPEAKAIQEGSKELGFDLSDLVWGRYCSYVSSQSSKKEVLEEAESICDKLFANPVMEAYEILSVKRIRDDGGRRG